MKTPAGRTRWRGVRFGLEKGAWGFAWRALMHWAITILTLGLLWPRMTFALEKYRTDRTFFGSARLTQEGRWPMLYRATLPFVASLLLLAAAVLWMAWLDPVFAEGAPQPQDVAKTVDRLFETGRIASYLTAPERLFLIPLGLAGLLFGAIYYRWMAKRIMAQHKTARGIRFASALSGVRVSFIYVLGNFIAYLFLVIGIMVLIFLALVAAGVDAVMADNLGLLGGFAGLPHWLSFGLLGFLYLGVFLLWGVLHNTFVTFPLMRHMARTTSLPQAEGLRLISQRERDAFAEAEGFAEALDLGAAI